MGSAIGIPTQSVQWIQVRPAYRIEAGTTPGPADDLAVSTPTYAVATIAPIPAGARPLVPAGFTAEIVASGAGNSRAIQEKDGEAA